MRTAVIGTLAIATFVAACQTAQEQIPVITPQPSVQPAPPPPNASYIPSGTVFTARLNKSLSAEDTRVGDTFTATVQDALIAQNGETVVPAGSVITGLVTGVGEQDGQAAVRVNLTRIEISGASHPFNGQITSTHVMDERRQSDDIARAAVIGGVAGAVLGAVIGGDLRDILIGGALGAGAGTVISLGVGDVEHELPAGTTFTIQTTERINLR